MGLNGETTHLPDIFHDLFYFFKFLSMYTEIMTLQQLPGLCHSVIQYHNYSNDHLLGHLFR